MVDEERVYSAFAETDCIARGSLTEVVLQVKARLDEGESRRIAMFDEETGYAVYIDFRGTQDEVLERLADHPMLPKRPAKRGPGRPKLGVVSREVSLLPRHWEWLGEQRGGASAELRRLVQHAMRKNQSKQLARKAKDAIHRFMWDMAGDLPRFEDASRALFASDYDALREIMGKWPAGIRDYLNRRIELLLPLEQEAARQVEGKGDGEPNQ